MVLAERLEARRTNVDAAVRRMRALVFAMAGPAPGEPETLTVSDIADTFTLLQAASEYLDADTRELDSLAALLALAAPQETQEPESLGSHMLERD